MAIKRINFQDHEAAVFEEAIIRQKAKSSDQKTKSVQEKAQKIMKEIVTLDETAAKKVAITKITDTTEVEISAAMELEAPTVSAVSIEKPESELKQMWYALSRNKAAVVGMVIIGFLLFLAIFGKWLMPYDPNYGDMAMNKLTPSSSHLFGTDEQGRDIFSRVIDGTRVSLSVGLAAVSFALVIGTFFGAIAGYKGGKIDTAIMRLMDIMMSIPDILLAITFMAALGRGIDKAVIAIGLVSIPEYARIVRGSIMSIKDSEYVQAAKVIGNTDAAIIFKHILPNVLSPIIVRATLGISSAVLNTAALGFLGLGVQPPYAEWGDMLGRARVFIFEAPYMLIFPGLAITITVLAFNLLGDGLRDAFDPKSRH